MNKTKLTKQEYRIVLDAYMRDSQNSYNVMTDEQFRLYSEIRNKLIKLGEVEA